jgi:hypothetical protein
VVSYGEVVAVGCIHQLFLNKSNFEEIVYMKLQCNSVSSVKLVS